MNARVVGARPESADATTLAFDAPGFAYRAGQWITIDPWQFPDLVPALEARAAKRGKRDGPGYFSVSSDALRPGYLEISVKAPPGLSPLASHLRTLRSGAELALGGPGGSYVLPDPPPEDVDGLLHVCAGSGVAPNRGLIRDALGRKLPLKHLLIVQDRTPDDRLFRAEWEALADVEEDRFRYVPLYSRTAGERVSAARIEAAARGFLELGRALGYVCGPGESRDGRPGFKDAAKAALTEAGLPVSRILL
jgi:3-ketosteroid 9alpha-monooxygenase subunit B